MKNRFIALTAFILIFTAFANAQTSIVGEWEIVSVMHEKRGNVPIDQSVGKVAFQKNRFYGSYCNSFSGSYSISKGKMKTSRIITTLMMCEDIETERLITSVFDKQLNYSLKNGVLTLNNLKNQLTLKLERVKKGKPSLVGSWQLKSFESGNKVFSWNGDVRLNIEKDKIGGNSGCNSYGGNVAMKGSSISFSNIISTKMFCEGSIESQYFASLEKVTNFELGDERLVLSDKAKQTYLTFDKVNK